MQQTKTPAPCGSRKAGSKRKGQKFYRPYFTTIKYPKSNLESRLKSWAVDRMAEALFEGRKSSQHKLAIAFWKKSGGRLTNV